MQGKGREKLRSNDRYCTLPTAYYDYHFHKHYHYRNHYHYHYHYHYHHFYCDHHHHHPLQVDTLTGESIVLSADIYYDCGQALNPAVDVSLEQSQKRRTPTLSLHRRSGGLCISKG